MGAKQPVERRPATLEEARALSNPIRLRIIRLCKDNALTNKELASRLALQPGTVLYHVRTLVTTGFLVEDPPRPGPRGTTEKPYRSTGKSWRLDIQESEERGHVHRAMLNAVAEELEEAGPNAILRSSRMAMRLTPKQLSRLEDQLDELTDEYGLLDQRGGQPVAMLVMLHRAQP